MSQTENGDSPIDLSSNSPQTVTSSTESVLSPDKPAAKKKVSKPSVLPTFLPPCRVCNAKASGFHYGANTCEACKAFFRRSIGHEHTIKPCARDGNCAENPNGKISCSDCRHKKCLAVGMAKEECRKGRYTYEKRTQDTKEIRRMQAQEVESKQIETDDCAGTLQHIVELFKTSFPDIYNYMAVKDMITPRVYQLVTQQNVNIPLDIPLFSPGANSDMQAWAERFYMYINQPGEICENQGYQMLFEAWMCEAERSFHGFTLFAKNLPGFSSLPLDDRILLLKQARGDTMNLTRHQMAYLELDCVAKFRYDTDDLALIPLTYMRHIVGDEFIDDMQKVTRRLQKLMLTVEDIAVLLAFLILTPDRENLHNPDQVDTLQEKLLPVLQYTLKKNHPTQPNIIADTLLIIPMLRENYEINLRSISKIRSQLNPDKYPLICEILKD